MALDNSLLDPLQGFDIKVEVEKSGTASTAVSDSNTQLVGAFTSLMFKIVNQTETYLPLNSRIPRMLDGELIVVWSLEQGLVDLNVVKNTFGSEVSTAFQNGRGTLIPRSSRFSIRFGTALAADDISKMKDSDVQFYQSSATVKNTTYYRLEFCRVDTMNFGVTAGRHVVANTWQGTAQHISNISTLS